MQDVKERMQIRLSKTNVERLNDMANRYGMTANSLVSYIVGHWLDNNYDLKDKMREKVFSAFDSDEKLEKLFSNPVYVDMMASLIREMADKERGGE